MISTPRCTTEREARAAGFIFQGSYFGIQVWIGDGDTPRVIPHWRPMKCVINLIYAYIDAPMQHLLYPERKPGFLFRIKRTIGDRQ